MSNPHQVSDRVQDEDGFTGTVTARWGDEVEVTWDISGCASDCLAAVVRRMEPGQDDKKVQSELHARFFPEEEEA